MRILNGHDTLQHAEPGDAGKVPLSREERRQILERCLLKGEGEARTVAGAGYFKRSGKARR